VLCLWRSTVCCRVVELTGDVAPDMHAVGRADVIVTTPEKWDGISRSWQTRSYVKAVTLLVIDEIHLLGIMLFSFYCYFIINIIITTMTDLSLFCYVSSSGFRGGFRILSDF